MTIIRRRLPRWLWWGALGLLGAAGVLAGTGRVVPEKAERPVDALAHLVVVSGCLAVAVGLRFPVSAAAVVTGTVLIYVARNYPDGPALLTGLAALFLLGSLRPRRVAYGFAVGMAAGVVAVSAVVDGGPGVVDLTFVGWAAAAVFAADAARSSRERRASRQAQAGLRAQARARELDRRLAEQRLRIAQDLHDSVGHAMAAITVQAAVAARLIDTDPLRAKESLEAVRVVGGQVLDELNAMVRVLRDDSTALAPAPELAHLLALAESANRAGTPVTLRVEVSDAAVTRPVATAVYRIVQESLTNVTRHAPGARATVSVAFDATDQLCVTVADDGAATPADSPGAGVGITGMQERAAATGGRLTVGPPAGPGSRGFTVTAVWPAAAAHSVLGVDR